MLPYAVLALGAVLGFVGSRQVRTRRPRRSTAVGSAARTASANLGRRKGLSAPELQRACFSEMVRHVRVGRDGRTTVPSRYRLRLHPDDLRVVDDARGWFVDGLADALRQAAAGDGWALDRRVEIDLDADPSRRPGAPQALAVDPAAGRRADPTPPPPAPRTTGGAAARRGGLALVTPNGDRHPLAGREVTVGRASERTVTIEDKRISRHHATLRATGDGWSVRDEGSANGTTVNGRSVPSDRPAPVEAGDVLALGPVELRVERAAPTPEPGTRALDDRDRTRIAGQVLPPPRRGDR